MTNNLLTVNPELAIEWHPTKNGNLKPTDIAADSNKKVWWMCKHGHEWQATVASRNAGLGCPYCSSKKVLLGVNDLQATNPELATEWHPTKNGDLKPTDVAADSNKKVWWKGKCGHEWETSPKVRGRGIGCPFCPL